MITEKYTAKLLHVQNGEIRHLLYSKVDEEELINRFRLVTKRETRKNVKDALLRLDKESLIAIVELSPEITESDIEACFEENRYSRRPNFRLFMLSPYNLQANSATFIASCKGGKAVQEINEILRDVVYPNDKITDLVAIDQTIINNETLEIGVKYKEKYNYIEPETEQSSFIYELRYGFLWINIDQKFATISIPNDSMVGMLSKAIEKAFECFILGVNITQSVVKSVFNKEAIKRTTLSNPNPSSGKPDRLTIADSNLGAKIDQLKEYEGFESPSSVYEENIEGEISSTLGINCDKGKIYLTRHLKASDMRSWGLWRISQIIGYINKIYENGDIDEIFETIGINEDPLLIDFIRTNDEKSAIIDIIKAIVICKKKGINSYKLLNLNTEKLVTVLKKHSIIRFRPYCDECDHYTDITCQDCGRSQLVELNIKKGKSSTVICSFCHEHFEKDAVKCLMDHKVRVDNWHDGILITPMSSMIELVQTLINKYFQDVGFTQEEEYFSLQNNIVHYSSKTSTKVMYKVTELSQFKRLWERKLSDKRLKELDEVMKLLREKCSKHSQKACHECQSEKSIRCIMKPFVTFTDHKLHAHHGQEYGDVSFTMQMLGMDDAVFVGIAKSYEKSEISNSSPKGREMLQQFVDKCIDSTVNVLGIIVAGQLDQGLVAKLQDLARRYDKKVLMWTYDELLLAVDYAIRHYGLKIADVITGLELEIELLKQKRRKKKVS